ncbi:MAG: hypothetical protein ACKOA0_11090, partial [Burkholderiaceae bacterium]
MQTTQHILSVSMGRKLLISALLSVTCFNAQAEDQTIEAAALRCSAISLVHSPLTIPTPQFGELMTQFAGLFAQIHMLHKSQRTNGKVDPTEIAKQRDAIIAEMRQGELPRDLNVVVTGDQSDATRTTLHDLINT